MADKPRKKEKCLCPVCKSGKVKDVSQYEGNGVLGSALGPENDVIMEIVKHPEYWHIKQ